MATWEYMPAIYNDEEIIHSAEVFIHCENCATIHSLSKYMEHIDETQDKNKRIELESIKEEIKRKRLEMLHAGDLTNSSRYKLLGAEMILEIILKGKSIDDFVKVTNLDNVNRYINERGGK